MSLTFAFRKLGLIYVVARRRLRTAWTAVTGARVLTIRIATLLRLHLRRVHDFVELFLRERGLNFGKCFESHDGHLGFELGNDPTLLSRAGLQQFALAIAAYPARALRVVEDWIRRSGIMCESGVYAVGWGHET